MGSKHIFVNYILESLFDRTDVDMPSSRYDPFNDKDLSVEEIMTIDETGRQINKKSDGNLVVNAMVQNALNQLPDIERDLIIGKCLQGKTVSKLSEEHSCSLIYINNTYSKAVSTFKELIAKEKQSLGIYSIHNLCPVCDHDKVDEIDEHIHLWLDESDWSFLGIRAKLVSDYGFDKNVPKKVVEYHIRYHMDTQLEVRLEKPKQLKKECKPRDARLGAVMVSEELKIRVEALSGDYHCSYSEIVRQSMLLGVSYLEAIKNFEEEAVGVAFSMMRFMRRLDD